jgi:hypothetical protein
MDNAVTVALITVGVALGGIAHDLFVATVVYFRRKKAYKRQEDLLAKFEAAQENLASVTPIRGDEA